MEKPSVFSAEGDSLDQVLALEERLAAELARAERTAADRRARAGRAAEALRAELPALVEAAWKTEGDAAAAALAARLAELHLASKRQVTRYAEISPEGLSRLAALAVDRLLVELGESNRTSARGEGGSR